MAPLTSYHRISLKKKLMGELLFRSWWVYAFIILNIAGFTFGYKQLEAKNEELGKSLCQLNEAKTIAEEKQRDLYFRIKSLEDPKSVEMILKQELGLISEGQTKVHFITPH